MNARLSHIPLYSLPPAATTGNSLQRVKISTTAMPVVPPTPRTIAVQAALSAASVAKIADSRSLGGGLGLLMISCLFGESCQLSRTALRPSLH